MKGYRVHILHIHSHARLTLNCTDQGDRGGMSSTRNKVGVIILLKRILSATERRMALPFCRLLTIYFVMHKKDY